MPLSLPVFGSFLKNYRVFEPFIWVNTFKLSTTFKVRTYYEVLNVSKNCSSEEIRNAFITLSKKYHPDVNQHSNAHSEYTKILEAYNILGKPSSRKLYDMQLFPSGLPKYKYDTNVHEVYTDQVNPIFKKSKKRTGLWNDRDKSEDSYYENQPYYGIKGIPRLSNSLIAWACLIFAGVGVTIQAYLIHRAMKLRRRRVNLQSAEAESILRTLRQEANTNGNDKQLELIQERIKGR